MTLTLLLVILTGLISYRALSDTGMFHNLSHQPFREERQKEYYRFLTAGFVHADFTHLLFNLYALWIFGSIVERQFLELFGELMGRVNYISLYLLTIVFANIPTYFKHRHHQPFVSVGASGGISGIIFVFILFNPWSTLLLFFVVPIPAIVAGVLYLVYSHYASTRMNDRIDHDAHFYGAVFGFLFTIALKPALFGAFLQNLSENFPF